MTASTVRRQAAGHLRSARGAQRSPSTTVEDTTVDQLDLLSVGTDLTPSPIDAVRAQAAMSAIRAGAGQDEYDALADAAIHLPKQEATSC